MSVANKNIISHRNCPQEALASFLAPTITASIEEPKYTCKNFQDFTENIKNIKIKKDEYSYDAEALY